MVMLMVPLPLLVPVPVPVLVKGPALRIDGAQPPRVPREERVLVLSVGRIRQGGT